MTSIKIVLAAAVALGAVAANAAPVTQAAITAAIADPARTDKERALDADRHPAELLAFLKLKAGDTVADVWPGDYWDRLFADVVGTKGKVYAVHLSEADKAEKVTTPAAGSAIFPEHANATVVVTTANTLTLPSKADVIWIRQNYHDLYDKFMGPSDVPAFNKAVYAALKPGGRFVIIDHVATAGPLLQATEKLHRIDPAVVKADMKAAGFTFVGESPVLRNMADPHDVNVFDKSVRGKTDQFVYVFARP